MQRAYCTALDTNLSIPGDFVYKRPTVHLSSDTTREQLEGVVCARKAKAVRVFAKSDVDLSSPVYKFRTDSEEYSDWLARRYTNSWAELSECICHNEHSSTEERRQCDECEEAVMAVYLPIVHAHSHLVSSWETRVRKRNPHSDDWKTVVYTINPFAPEGSQYDVYD